MKRFLVGLAAIAALAVPSAASAHHKIPQGPAAGHSNKAKSSHKVISESSAVSKALYDARPYCRTTFSGNPLYSCYAYGDFTSRSYTDHTWLVTVLYREGQNYGQGWFFYYCTAYMFYTHGERRRDLEGVGCN